MKLSSHHAAISVANLERSLVFYNKLGFQEVHRYDDGAKTNVHLALGDFYLEIFNFQKNNLTKKLDYNYLSDLEVTGLKHVALKTDNVYEALDELRSIGLADDSTVIDDSVKDLQYFFIRDPDGIWLEIINDGRY